MAFDRGTSATRGKLDFLVVGAEKCGTTWLARMLSQHPQVFIPAQKELHYFNRWFVETPELPNQNFDQPISWYLAFFAPASPGQKKGEVCPAYLWDEEAPGRIFAFDPTLQILMILRHPVERTLSAYRYYVQRGVIREPLPQALEKFSHQLVLRSLYATQVERYLRLFPQDQVHIFLYDDLRSDPVAFLRTIERMLGVDEVIPSDVLVRSNVSGDAKWPWLNRLMYQGRTWLRKYLPMPVLEGLRALGIAEWAERIRQRNRTVVRPTTLKEISPELRQHLVEMFRPDVVRLQHLIGRDLSAWLQ